MPPTGFPIISLAAISFGFSGPAAILAAKPVPVTVTVNASTGMQRGGQPYTVKGAGGEEKLAALAALGANSIRTWGTEKLAQTLDEAAKHQLTVSAGIWLEPECAWFSYHKPGDCAKQAARVKSEVTRYRGHPALLAWGLGNEAEGEGSDPAFWQQLERLAVLVRELDSAHPTFTALAGITATKAASLNQHTPHLDYVGINTYAALTSLRKTLTDLKWTRPWMVTEWGARGFWESPRGAGGMALEQTSSEKAAMVARGYDEVIAPGGACMGSYAFLWGWKNEGSVSWFGLMTEKGETIASVDVLQQRWSGRPPANTAPAITPVTGIPAGGMAPGSPFQAATSAKDAEGDPLTWRWAIRPGAEGHNNGISPPTPPAVPDTLKETGTPQVEGRAPARKGKYRLYVEVSDGHGHAATANAPLLVE